MSVLEWMAFSVSIAAVWLTTRRQFLCWPLGLLSVGLYAWVFATARLYSDATLQLVFAAFIVYGWHCWRRAPRQHDEPGRRVHVRAHPGWLRSLLHLMLGGAFAAIWGALLAVTTDAALPMIDAELAGFSLVAQYWTARLYRINWVLWIFIDTAYVALYINRGLFLTALLYAIFAAMAVAGWWQWREEDARPAGPAP
jgi:nicotinamide mononucleotide transporter